MALRRRDSWQMTPSPAGWGSYLEIFSAQGGVNAKSPYVRCMAWFLIAAAVAIVAFVSLAAIAWAKVVRDGIRLVDRLTRRPPD
jgi:hypothetical protein